jgi:hypothetical protein
VIRALLLLAFLAPVALADVPSDLARAQELFAAAQGLEETTPSARAKIEAGYRAAAEGFRAIHEGGVISARLFANTGNAYYFARDLGEANLWYSRALLLNPGEPRAKAGRLLVRSRLPWEAPTSVTADLLGTLFFWHEGLTFSVRQALFLLLWPLAFALLALARTRRWALWPGVLLVVAGGALLGSLSLSASEGDGRDQGVVRVAVEGRSGDGKSYSLSHSAPLPAGSEVRVVEERDAWVHVSLPDGSASWIPSEAVARVVPPT